MPRKYTKADLATLSGDLKAPLPAPKKRKNEESAMQRALLGWWHTYCGTFQCHPWLLFSIPNGSNWDAKRGSILRAEGLRRGVPDLLLAVARQPELSAAFWRGWHGLFLELKTVKGVLSPEQKQYHALLKAAGYQVAVIRSLEEGIATITEYLT